MSIMTQRRKQMSDLMLSKIGEKDIQTFFLPKEKSKIDLEMSYLLRIKEKEPTLMVNDFREFISKAQTFGADPLKDQIYLVPYNTKHGRFASVIFSYHFQLSRAEEHPQYDGYEVEDGIGEYLNVATGEVSKRPYVICKVHRKDRKNPTVFKAWFDEFKKETQDYNTKEKKLNSQWSSQPMNMLRKCALSNALKQAFPQELSGMNTEYDIQVEKEEVPVKQADQSNVVETTCEKVEPEKVVVESAKTERHVMTFGPFVGEFVDEVTAEQIKPIYTMTKKGAQQRIEKGESVSEAITKFLTACESAHNF